MAYIHDGCEGSTLFIFTANHLLEMKGVGPNNSIAPPLSHAIIYPFLILPKVSFKNH